jgi:hypothetical protein
MNIEKLLPSYPKQNDPEIQRILSDRKEFRELSAIQNEKLEPGKFFNHQEMNMRFIRQYNKLILIHEAGSGKTGTMSAIIQDLRLRKDLDGRVSGFLVISTSRGLLDEFKSQMVFKYTGGKFLDETILSNPSPKEKKKSITIALNRVGILTNTYRRFRNEIVREFGVEVNNKVVLNDDSWQRIAKKYEHTCICADEIHSILNFTATASSEGIEVYEFLKLFFRKVPNLIIILSTATPMINDAKEITKIIDLLSERDFEGEIDVNNPNITEVLYKWLNGKVSVVRAQGTNVEIRHEGSPLDIHYKQLNIKSQLVLFTGLMSPFQSIAYLKAYFNDIAESTQQKGSNKGSAWLRSRQASGFVYPNGEIGKKGFDYYFKSKGDRFTSDKLLKEIKGKTKEETLGNIARYSTKMANDLNTLDIYPGVRFVYFEFVESGVAPFCVCLKALGFERFDEKKEVVVNDRITIKKKPRFGVITGRATDKNVVDSLITLLNHPDNLNGDYVRIIVGSRATRIGYSFYHCQVIDIFEPWWNPSSIYQAISRGIRATGHDALIAELKKQDPNARVPVHILNSAALPITRQDAIDMLDNGKEIDEALQEELQNYGEQDIEELRVYARLLEEYKTKDLSTIKVEKVEISVIEPSQPAEQEDIEDIQQEQEGEEDVEKIKEDTDVEIVNSGEFPISIDVRMYQDAEQKEIEIKRVIRSLKIIAYDANLNRARNIRPDDIDGSSECDYMKCDYQPLFKADNQIDYSTYDLLYSGDLIEKRKDVLVEELILGNQQLQPKDVLDQMAILELQQTPITGDLGYSRFYSNQSNFLYPRLADQSSNPLDDYYLDSLIVIDQKNINTVASLMANEQEKIKEIRRLPLAADLKTEVESIQNESLILLMEMIMLDDRHSATDNKLLRVFTNYIHHIIDPSDLITIAQDMILRKQQATGETPSTTPRQTPRLTPSSLTPKTRGRPKLDPKKEDWASRYQDKLINLSRDNKVRDINKLIEKLRKQGVNIITVHTLSLLNPAQDNYGSKDKYVKFIGDLRIRDGDRFREPSEAEKYIYSSIISGIYREKIDKRELDENVKHYGVNIPTITTKTKVPIFSLSTDVTDETGKSTAHYKVCTSYNVKVLTNLLIDMNYQPQYEISEADAIAKSKASSEYGIPYINPEEDIEDLERIYRIKAGEIFNDLHQQNEKVSKETLCSLIKDQLIKDGLYMELLDWSS